MWMTSPNANNFTYKKHVGERLGWTATIVPSDNYRELIGIASDHTSSYLREIKIGSEGSELNDILRHGKTLTIIDGLTAHGSKLNPSSPLPLSSKDKRRAFFRILLTTNQHGRSA